VGGDNYRFFLGFLLLHALFLGYCSYISGAVLLSEVSSQLQCCHVPAFCICGLLWCADT
jgi:hypothetical protein